MRCFGCCRPAGGALVAWQSSIDRVIQVGSPSRYEVWFEEKEISHGQISRYPHGGGTQCAAENGVVGEGSGAQIAPWSHFVAGGCESGRHAVYRCSHCRGVKREPVHHPPCPTTRR